MTNTTRSLPRSLSLGAAAVAAGLSLALLTGCGAPDGTSTAASSAVGSGTTATPSDGSVSNSDGATSAILGAATGAGIGSAEAANRFMACLDAAGVSNREFQGLVLVPSPGVEVQPDGSVRATATDDGLGNMNIQMVMGDGRMWTAPTAADALSADLATMQAWVHCQEQVPNFVNDFTALQDLAAQHTSGEAESQAEALDIAARARAAGFDWVSDPAPGTSMLEIPEHITKAELIAMFTEVLGPDGTIPGFGWGNVGLSGNIPVADLESLLPSTPNR